MYYILMQIENNTTKIIFLYWWGGGGDLVLNNFHKRYQSNIWIMFHPKIKRKDQLSYTRLFCLYAINIMLWCKEK